MKTFLIILGFLVIGGAAGAIGTSMAARMNSLQASVVVSKAPETLSARESAFIRSARLRADLRDAIVVR